MLRPLTVLILITILHVALDDLFVSADTVGDKADIIGDEVAMLQIGMNLEPAAENSSESESPNTTDGNSAGASQAWMWLLQNPSPGAQHAESVRRFHRQFIAVAVLMLCVLPWSRDRQQTNDSDTSQQQGSQAHAQHPRLHKLRKLLSSCCHPCYLSVLVLWLKHYVFQRSFLASEALIMFAGFTLDIEGHRHRRQDDTWNRYCNLIPERFSRLYPFYALYVILHHAAVPWMGRFCNLFLESSSVVDGQCYQLFVVSSWLLSNAFGWYILLPVFQTYSREIGRDADFMLPAACVALVLLPRTLTSNVHPRWASLAKASQQTSVAHSTPSSFPGAIGQIVTTEPLLSGLVNFLIGIVFARAWLAVKLGSMAPFIGASDNVEQARQATGQRRGKKVANNDGVLSSVELLDLLGPLRSEAVTDVSNGDW